MPDLDEPEAGEHLQRPAYRYAAAAKRGHQLVLGRQPGAGGPCAPDYPVPELFKDLLLDTRAPHRLEVVTACGDF